MLKIPKERDIQRAIIEWLELHKIPVMRVNNMGVPLKNGKWRPPREKGLPDLIACVKGRMVAIEVKAPGKKPTRFQEAFLKRLDDAGALTIVASSVEFVEKCITEFFKK